MKNRNYNHRHLAVLYIIGLTVMLLVILLLIGLLEKTKKVNETIEFQFTFISFIMISFNLTFFFFPFIFKQKKFLILNQIFNQKKVYKNLFFWILPICFNLLCGSIVIIVGFIKPLNLVSENFIIFLFTNIFILILIDLSYLLFASKLNQKIITKKEIDFSFI